MNELCDRFVTAAFSANLITYLTQELHLPLVEASNTLTNFSGTASLTPILGALAAYSFAGSAFYQLGMVGLVVSALIPSLRPGLCSPPATPCRRANGLQVAVLYLSLLCTSLGSGGIRPCVLAFGADQFDQHKEQHNSDGDGGTEAVAGRKRQYVNLYFFTMGFTVLLALTVVVYIQENVGLVGYPLYVRLKPGDSPFTRLAQVIAAAYKKRTAPLPEDPGMLYQDKELDALISTNGKLRGWTLRLRGGGRDSRHCQWEGVVGGGLPDLELSQQGAGRGAARFLRLAALDSHARGPGLLASVS